ncbi:MAG: hypothetical protein Q9220_002471 [cf. Caloplaca sp. 1 TL-2023]
MSFDVGVETGDDVPPEVDGQSDPTHALRQSKPEHDELDVKPLVVVGKDPVKVDCRLDADEAAELVVLVVPVVGDCVDEAVPDVTVKDVEVPLPETQLEPTQMLKHKAPEHDEVGVKPMLDEQLVTQEIPSQDVDNEDDRLDDATLPEVGVNGVLINVLPVVVLEGQPEPTHTETQSAPLQDVEYEEERLDVVAGV